MNSGAIYQVLVVEDESIIRQSMVRLLSRHGFCVHEADSLQQAKSFADWSQFDLILTDIRLPDGEGTELIALAAPTSVLVMTSYASLKSAVAALKKGAVDYIAKPFDHDELIKLIKQNLRHPPKTPSIKTSKNPDHGMIGNCVLMQRLYHLLAKVAPVDSTVLILGESGTGKELVAKALHQQSPRLHGPFISVNCAAIPESMIEAELFGHEKGAFTGAYTSRTGLVEAADGGSLFLDEIGELPLEAQARLLRLLQEKEVRPVGATQAKRVNVRLIAATHRNLRDLILQGKFREDLFYRLHVIELRLPALRERGEDVLALAQFFLVKMQQKAKREGLSLSAKSLAALQSYDWPGNVRELEHAIERAVVLTDSAIIEPDLLGLPLYVAPLSLPEFSSDASLEQYLQRFILDHQEQMNETELAEKLGISRKTLWEKRQKLGIPRRKVQL
jgi:DNA-binding NtrC family response regulator